MKLIFTIVFCMLVGLIAATFDQQDISGKLVVSVGSENPN